MSGVSRNTEPASSREDRPRVSRASKGKSESSNEKSRASILPFSGVTWMVSLSSVRVVRTLVMSL